jgi:16S rRNA (cytosine967-C5)-methyltransferase
MVLDLCAGVGGKTFQFAFSVGPRGHVAAVDRGDAKLNTLSRNAGRFDLENVAVIRGDVITDRLPRAKYIFLDAPCSNLGVIRRKPDIKWRVREGDVAAAAALQKALLGRALSRLEPGGRLVYYVCTTETEECEEVVEAAVTSRPGFMIADFRTRAPGIPSDGLYYRTWPHRHGVNGGFGAVIERCS